MVDRRSLLRWGVTGALGVALPAGTAAVAASLPTRPGPPDGPPVSPPPAGAFTVPLPVPITLTPVSTAGGVDRYEIRQAVGRHAFRPGTMAEIWGYNGIFPGPTIRARRGRPVVVTHHNDLTVPTVVHLHGGILPARDDGYPVDYVTPAGVTLDAGQALHAQHGVAGPATGSRDYTYPNEQSAATLWYHDHRMSFTGLSIYRGLAGFYLIGDDVEDALPLPRGDRDIPLMIADRTFNPDGSLFYPLQDPTMRRQGVTLQYHHSGMLGDTVTVNGIAWPVLEVEATLYRFRILNASNARVYRLELDPPPPGGNGLIQIGSDTGLLPSPVAHQGVGVSPGERYDILVDFARYQPGTQVTLRNTVGDNGTGYVMRFDVTRRAADDARIPQRLTDDPAPPPAGTAADRTFSFVIGPEGVKGPPMINNRVFAIARIDAGPTHDTTEVWDLTADPTHPIHLHGAHFRILRRDGGPPDAQDAGWKDTVFVPSGGVRIAVTFGRYRGKYAIHCHNLEHGDAGMMANLEIT